MRHRTAGITPDLGAGATVVRLGVVLVAKLIKHLALPFGLHAQGQVTRALHTLGLGHFDQLCAVGGHRRLALGAHVVRHDQHHAIAFNGRSHGQCDASIAGGRLDQRIAGLDIATCLGTLDHRQRRAVLH